MLLFATSALLLFADGGLLYDYFPYFTPPMDKFGIGLGLTLAVKESAFLLWILAAVLSEKRLLQQVIVLDSLGYSRWQCLNWLLLPSIAPALAMAMLAIVAWSLSVVDVAIILGPGNPPTLAVISWQWFNPGRRRTTDERRTRQPAAAAVTRRLRFAGLSAMA
ncbi:ABC transporter permease [Escherichia coli]|uniref:ABC transporter permease n=1 Tax=Escherichia coli TaxID=562 RepID=A0A376LMW9_ECOLX|nr:ABC transporter permease [Escherichia coli]